MPTWAESFTSEGIVYALDKSTHTASVIGTESKDLTSAVIASSVDDCEVTSIANDVFENCVSLQSVSIPSTVTTIGENAFWGCTSLRAFTVDEANPNYSTTGDVLYNKDQSQIVKVGCNVAYLSIPSSVTSIGSFAFSNCTALTSITLPSSITSIADWAFAYCKPLRSVGLPSTLTSIGSWAFAHCTSLRGISLPASVTNVSNSAFAYCSSLSELTLPSTTTSIADWAFAYCTSLQSVSIPASVTNIGNDAFKGCTAITAFNVDAANTSYTAEGSVLYNKNKTTIVKACADTENFEIPSSVTSISYGAFEDCQALQTINIPTTVTSIGSWAFAYNSSLTSVTLPSTLATTPSWTFAFSNALPTIDIPSSVTNIGSGAFSGCTSLNEVSFESTTTPTIEDNVFTNISSDAKIIVPNGSLSSYQDALNGYDFNILEKSILQLQELYAQALSTTDRGIDALASADETTDNILTDASQLSTNAQEPTEGAIANLVDGNINTFFHSTWSQSGSSDTYHYLQIDLKEAYKNLLLNYYKRQGVASNSGEPVKVHVFATNNAEATDWTDCGYVKFSYNFDNNQSGKCPIALTEAYRYIRLQVEETGTNSRANGNLYFYLSELGVSPITKAGKADYTANDGLITDASQLSTNAQEPREGSLAALIDNDRSTFFHSTWSVASTDNAHHYIQVDLKAAYKQITLKYSRREVAVDNSTPVTLHVYGTDTPDNADSWTDLGTHTCTYEFDYGKTGLLPLDLGKGYRHVRLTVDATTQNSTSNGNLYFYWSELHAYSRACQADLLDDNARTTYLAAIATAKQEIANGATTEATATALQNGYNAVEEAVNAGAISCDFAKSFYLTAYSNHAHLVPTGVDAAVVVANSESIRNDYRYTAGNVIPTETGVLLRSGKGNSFILAATETSETAPEENLLHGTLTDELTDVDGAGKYYKLSYDKATGTEIGFYYGAEDGAAFVNKGGKAFLALPATLNAAQLAGFSLFDLDNANSSTTGIEDATTTANAHVVIFDLNGRRVNANSIDGLSKGIYIVNGKKIIKQ